MSSFNYPSPRVPASIWTASPSEFLVSRLGFLASPLHSCSHLRSIDVPALRFRYLGSARTVASMRGPSTASTITLSDGPFHTQHVELHRISFPLSFTRPTQIQNNVIVSVQQSDALLPTPLGIEPISCRCRLLCLYHSLWCRIRTVLDEQSYEIRPS